MILDYRIKTVYVVREQDLIVYGENIINSTIVRRKFDRNIAKTGRDVRRLSPVYSVNPKARFVTIEGFFYSTTTEDKVDRDPYCLVFARRWTECNRKVANYGFANLCARCTHSCRLLPSSLRCEY